MTESLIQAYANSPRRQKLQIMGGFFLALVIFAVLLVSYLVVSARAVSMGRQLQQAKYEIDRLVYLNVNYRSAITSFAHFEELEEKAADLGFRAPYPGEVFYIEVPGYGQKPRMDSDGLEKTAAARINVNLLEYHESLLDWFRKQMMIFIHPFQEL